MMGRLGSWAAVASMCFAAVGCGSTAAPRERESAGETAEAIGTSGFAFVTATRTRVGYRVAAVNGAPVRCAGWLQDTCDVGAVDLSQLALADDDARAILGEISADARRPTLLFVGQLATSRGRTRLVVYEAWRAPAPVALRGDVIHVSRGSTGLLVDWWDETTTVTGLDLTRAPKIRVCTTSDDGAPTCAPSLDPALSWPKSAAGLVVVGTQRADGVVVASQYFIRVDIGHALHSDGYTYCRADQVVCSDTGCVGSIAECDVKTGRGRGLIPQIRTDLPAIQEWLVTTGQIPAVVAP